MAKTIYDFTDYREYLKSALPVSGPNRGGRAKLAEALGCQNGFVSLVIGGGAHFSIEHALKVSRYLMHDPAEQDYFMLLVQYARAGSRELERYFSDKIQAVQRKRREIRERIHNKTPNALSESSQAQYYSSWHHVAVHMCLMIPQLQTRKAISDYLKLPPAIVSEILSFMTKTGLAVQNGDRFLAGPARLHLPSGSPFLPKHHTNWRMKAIQSLDEPKRSDLHYSLVMSLSEPAAEQIRTIIMNAIQEVEPVLKAAKDETVYTLNIDLFGLGSS